MPRYKVLKGIAHNIGHSFTSFMNYAGDDYAMGHILRFARETGQDTLVIDLQTGEGRPSDLLRDPISQLPHWYTKMFWNMVSSAGSDRTLVQSANLKLKFDLTKQRSGQTIDSPESPFTCDVSIVDNRGKNYTSHFDGWWHVERIRLFPSARRWWNPITWFQREK